MNPAHAAFFREYERLNPAQKEAVDTIEGPVMVIAGPGTGKTQILTLRIANIMRQSDVPPDAILALTFTNAAAANMRKRLVSIVGSEGYRVSIFTFHSFANHLLETRPERFGEAAGFSNISEVEQLDVLRLLVDTGRYERIKPLGEPYRAVADLKAALSHLKKEGYTPERFAAWVAHEKAALLARDDLTHTKGVHKGKMKGEHERLLRALEKDEELADLFARYQSELARRKRYDFDDALLLVCDALAREESFVRELQEEYQYFLVDEHQDTNGAQNTILERLVTWFERPNVFVVGDEKQAIFRFQGASLENFLYFQEKFSDVRRITLTENYRSHQGVLDAAHALIGHAREGIPAPLTAAQGAVHPIDIYRLQADDEELLFVAEAVQTRLSEGVPPQEIAVLVRTNRDILPVRDYFERLGIPHIVESGHGVLDDLDIRKLNTILDALTDLGNDDLLVRVLFLDLFSIAVPDVYALIRSARQDKRPLLEACVSPTNALTDAHAVAALTEKLFAWKRAFENEPFLNAFETLVRECGILTRIERSAFHTEKFDKLVRLFDELKAHTARTPFFSLADYHTFRTILTEHRLSLEAKSRHIVAAVRLMTAHRAKGLEFDHVYVTQAYDGHWGGRRARASFYVPYAQGTARESGEDTEDERRLFYVALTRARKELAISYALTAPDGRERVPSQFVEEIRPELARVHTGEDVGVAGKRPPLFVPRSVQPEIERYRPYVEAHLAERGLSATSLTSYLRCPWQWFYNHFFHSQFVKSVHQKRGTAVHAALQAFFDKRNTDPTTPVEYLLERFTFFLTAEDLDPTTFERVHRDSAAALVGWHRAYHAQWPLQTINELKIRGVLLDETILLTGALDKLECVSGGCGEVDVVDYKTGKPKSRNEIEGKTQARGSGDYKRQLVFYKLLLSLFEKGRYGMRYGVLDFIEPNDRGVYKRESFEITEAEVEAVRDEVRRVHHEIHNLAFWDTRCEDETCAACALRELSLAG